MKDAMNDTTLLLASSFRDTYGIITRTDLNFDIFTLKNLLQLYNDMDLKALYLKSFEFDKYKASKLEDNADLVKYAKSEELSLPEAEFQYKMEICKHAFNNTYTVYDNLTIKVLASTFAYDLLGLWNKIEQDLLIVDQFLAVFDNLTQVKDDGRQDIDLSFIEPDIIWQLMEIDTLRKNMGDRPDIDGLDSIINCLHESFNENNLAAESA